MVKLSLRGKITQLIYPNYGFCARCQTVWALVEGVSVSYHSCTEEARVAYARRWYPEGKEIPKREDDYSRTGLFAICTECWEQLTPEERLPYYADLYWENYRGYFNDPAYPNMAKTRQQAELEWEEIETRILTNNLNRVFSAGRNEYTDG